MVAKGGLLPKSLAKPSPSARQKFSEKSGGRTDVLMVCLTCNKDKQVEYDFLNMVIGKGFVVGFATGGGIAFVRYFFRRTQQSLFETHDLPGE
jgi:hypothetical protein